MSAQLRCCRRADRLCVLPAEPSSIIFLCHLPNSVHGEQLYAQLVAAVASRGWLFQYGRVKMVVLCSEALALVSMRRASARRTLAC